MSCCGCCRWRQNEVVSCGGEAPAGFPFVFWPLRNVDSCLGYNWGRWSVQSRPLRQRWQMEMKATFAMKHSNSDLGLLVRWSPKWRSWVRGLVDASLMAALMPDYITVIADKEDLKVSLNSESTFSSVHHQFCCGAVMFWCVPSRWVSLIFHNCLHLLLNTRPPVEKILLHCLLSSPDPGHPRGNQWGRKDRKVGDIPPVCSSSAQASSSCLWLQTLASTILIFRSPCRSCDSGVGIVV